MPESYNPAEKKRPVRSGSMTVVETLSDGRMYLEKGVTKNMGAYESARVTVGFEFAFTAENYDHVKRLANNMIDRELTKQVDELFS